MTLHFIKPCPSGKPERCLHLFQADSLPSECHTQWYWRCPVFPKTWPELHQLARGFSYHSFWGVGYEFLSHCASVLSFNYRYLSLFFGCLSITDVFQWFDLPADSDPSHSSYLSFSVSYQEVFPPLLYADRHRNVVELVMWVQESSQERERESRFILYMVRNELLGLLLTHCFKWEVILPLQASSTHL